MAEIVVRGLTKSFGKVVAVDDLSFTLPQGKITGFLGANGAGKTTTLRMLLGLVSPTSGTATVDGRPYGELRNPIRQVGALLEASLSHPGRSGRNHLRTIADAAGIPASRIDRVLDMVDLSEPADRRVGGYSLGMRQRLGLATALIGDPEVLVLDEPTNGLDPVGVRWLRGLLQDLRNEGRTILISSHLLAELAQSVDHVVVIDKGRLIANKPLEELAGAGKSGVRVRTPDRPKLIEAFRSRNIRYEAEGNDEAMALDATPQEVGDAVAAAGVVIYEMSLVNQSLESAFLRLINKEEVVKS